MIKQNTPPAVSVIVTVRNEAKQIDLLLSALFHQSTPPAEVIVIDAASTDTTVQKIETFQRKHPQLKIIVESFPCNRSTGRNRAISLASSPLIAITDAGCVPTLQWLSELLRAYQPGHVVAGYAVGVPSTAFEEAVIPYLLVMPDRVNPKTYLPATRSMLLEKTTWQHVGKFDESLNTSEDFIFAMKIKSASIPILFTPQAVVKWTPPSSVRQFAKTILSFAACDMAAGVLRPKVVTVYGRYILGVLFVFALVNLHLMTGVSAAVGLLAIYSFWAIKKNANYVKRGKFWLPVLQFIADGSVMLGTGWGAVSYLLGQRTSRAPQETK